MSSSIDNVAIIGGGLAGLTTALSLTQNSIKCRVYESRLTGAAPPTSSGALMLSPNALRILDNLGLYSRILPLGYAFEHVYYYQHTGKLEDRYPMGGSDYGYPALRVYRQDLLDVLHAACAERGIDVVFGKKFSRVVREDNEKGEVEVEFADGTTTLTNMLVGADGIHSAVREYVVPGVQKKFIGLAAVTWEVPTAQLRVHSEEGKEKEKYRFPLTVLGPKNAFVLAPQRPDGSAMLAGTQMAVPEMDRNGWAALLADKEGLVNRVDMGGADYWPDLVKSALEDIDRDTLNLWPFYTIPRLSRWASPSGRVVLLGDAAHAIPPTTGQGASQAFEDAASLARLLGGLREGQVTTATTTTAAALEFWQGLRQDRIDALLVLTRQLNNKRLPLEQQKALPKGEVWFDESAENPEQMAWLFVPRFEEAVDAWIEENAGRGP